MDAMIHPNCRTYLADSLLKLVVAEQTNYLYTEMKKMLKEEA